MRPRVNLDALRAFAVVTVLIDHAAFLAGHPFLGSWDLRWLGVFGVYLFFVHTCLVLMWSLERRPDTLDFYIRRIFRIYPLAILAVLLVAGLRMSYMYAPTPFSRGLLLSNLLLMQNVWPHPNIMGTLWSLPLEVDMYLLLPVFAAYARRENSIWPFVVLWFFACLLNLVTYGPHAGNDWYMVIPHFLPGIMAYVGFRTRTPHLPAWTLAVTVALVTAGFMVRPCAQTGWVACLLLGLLLPLFRDSRSRLVEAVSHRLATYSYGIYLLHLIVFRLCFRHLAGHSPWLILGIALPLTLLGAVLAYHLIEEPMIRLGSRVAQALTHRRAARLTTQQLNLEVAP